VDGGNIKIVDPGAGVLISIRKGTRAGRRIRLDRREKDSLARAPPRPDDRTTEQNTRPARRGDTR